MNIEIVSTEYRIRKIRESLSGCPQIIWVRAVDQVSAAASFSAGVRKFRLDVMFSNGAISIYRNYENVPYHVIKIAEAEAKRNNETISIKLEADTFSDAKEEVDIERLSNPLGIKKVIFNGPATIVIWADGSKTIVKLMAGDDYDPEKAIMMCLIEKMLGSKADVKRFFKKWIPEVDLSELGESIGTIASELGKSIGKMVKSVAKALENSVSETEENKKGHDPLELLEQKREKAEYPAKNWKDDPLS